jgi:hypothetical protein
MAREIDGVSDQDLAELRRCRTRRESAAERELARRREEHRRARQAGDRAERVLQLHETAVRQRTRLLYDGVVGRRVDFVALSRLTANLDDLARNSDRVRRHAKGLGEEAGRTGREVDDARGALLQMRRAAAKLQSVSAILDEAARRAADRVEEAESDEIAIGRHRIELPA